MLYFIKYLKWLHIFLSLRGGYHGFCSIFFSGPLGPATFCPPWSSPWIHSTIWSWDFLHSLSSYTFLLGTFMFCCLFWVQGKNTYLWLACVHISCCSCICVSGLEYKESTSEPSATRLLKILFYVYYFFAFKVWGVNWLSYF